MPRAFTEAEREAVAARLCEAARRSLVERGFRATSVATLAREAGISKGAFYLFYDSKEALVATVLAEEEQAVRAALDALMARPETTVVELVRFLFDILARHPVLRLLSDADDAAVLFRAVPPDELAARLRDDDDFFAKRCRRWQRAGKLARAVSPSAFARIPRVALAIAQQRALVGEDHYEAVLELVIRGLAHELSPR